MRLITFQDIFVIKKIEYEEEMKRPPVFFNRVLNLQDREVPIFNKFLERMKDDLKLPKDRNFIPIWCWVIRKNENLDNSFINELYTRSVPHCMNLTLFELDIPDEHVFISNFHVWQEICFKTKFNIPVDDNLFNKLFEKQKGAILQACIPFIHKQFITNVKYYNRAIDNDYSDTEIEIKELINSGDIELDNKGNISKYLT